ncbi:MAG: NAD(P)/FAD-dependent oxidoreductase [Spirochaetaceae bacterium]|jgi:glycerol-3-phosphate dehydrogenase|nr:NAD(P)/FAD-dependent oxidoreductase [Spirochaetaceae bacterium]
MLYDVIIIGAGVIGGAIARALSQYQLSVLCLEKETDVSCGVSKANTGIIHSPSLIHGGTKKAEYTIRGNIKFEQLGKDLGVQVQWPGALILAYSEENRSQLVTYKKQGEDTRDLFSAGDGQYRFIEKEELLEMEPFLNEEVQCALFVPDAGRIIPYEFTIALWENAIEKGVLLELNQSVESVTREANSNWLVKTGKGEYQSRFVVNSAGHGSNDIGLQAGFKDSSIQKVKGQYLIYDQARDFDINHILFQVPSKDKGKVGKGILVCKTVYGNLMIGPDAQWVKRDDDSSTDLDTLSEVLEGARKTIPRLDIKKIIKTFAGVRPKPDGGDFIIEFKNHFVHLCGIESPGLTSSPAIAEDVLSLLKEEGLDLTPNPFFNPIRKPVVDSILHLSGKELKERVELPDSDPDQIVCRCEQVPRARIIDAIQRGIYVNTLDGVKRRTRAGQGRCQGAFCGKRVTKLLSEELGVSVDAITQRGTEVLENRITAKDFLGDYTT